VKQCSAVKSILIFIDNLLFLSKWVEYIPIIILYLEVILSGFHNISFEEHILLTIFPHKNNKTT